jgi:hypothetical protein
MSITQRVCVCVIQHAPYCQLWSAQPDVTIFGGKRLLNTKRVFWFSLQLLSETFPILKRNERDMIKIRWFSCKVPFILVRFLWHLHFLNGFSKNPQVSNFTKIRAMGAELFHADGKTDRQADMTKLVVALRNFANAPTNESTSHSGRSSRVSIIPNFSTEADFRMKEKFLTAYS